MRSLRIGALSFLLIPLASAQTAPLNVVYIGDSITFGATLPNPGTQATAEKCTEALQAKLAPRPVYMSNQGFCGVTTVDYRAGTGLFGGAENAAKQLQAAHPGQLLFSIVLGTNDSAVKGTTGAPVAPADYQANLGKIVDQLLTDFPESKIVIHHPIWYSPNTHNGAIYDQEGLTRLNLYLPKIDALVQDEAQSHPGRVFLGDTAAWQDFQQNHEKNLTAEQGAEGTFYLHPNLGGAVVLGQFWAQAMVANGMLK
jgi:lysophospholipase L1-like esterase